jgi:hypothetical protein
MLYFYDLSSSLQTPLPPSRSKPSSLPLPLSHPFLGIALPSGLSAICVKWQSKTNQIFCSLSNGKTKVFFDPRLSTKGVILTAGRAPKREKDPSDYAHGEGSVYTPDSLPMFKVCLLSLPFVCLFVSSPLLTARQP